ncbi:MAG TPA: hypothetical protein VF601_10475 [Beijerinckiaceae bacterium]|jgi:hypothetical protein
MTADRALDFLRRNPVLAFAAAAGAGFLLYRASREGGGRAAIRAQALEEESIPVLVTGHDRIYDPDTSPRHPTQDLVETRRETSARA